MRPLVQQDGSSYNISSSSNNNNNNNNNIINNSNNNNNSNKQKNGLEALHTSFALMYFFSFQRAK
jgi:hypothetical protein